MKLAAPKQRACMTVRATQEPVLKRPERPEAEAPAARKLFNEEAATPAAPVPTPSTSGGMTIEYQRQRAKELTKYFRDMKMNETVQEATTFGWTLNNEIGNGRWVMFGLLVGMLTESATGVDFVDQLKLMVTYMGIADLE